MKTEYQKQGTSQQQPPQQEQQREQNVDGFDQVFQMLKIADPAFRESLLQRLSSRDGALAKTLRQKLADAGL